MNKLKGSDPSVQIFNGDKVLCPDCFGDDVLAFVGMAQQLNFNNDCVVVREGNAVPVKRAGLIKVTNE